MRTKALRFSVGPLIVSLGFSLQAPISQPEISFVDIAPRAGITLEDLSGGPKKRALLETLGHGAAWFDYDNDGFVDLYIANGSTMERLLGQDRSQTPDSRLYRNRGDGTFEDVTGKAGVSTGSLWAMGAVAADYDNDGNQDLYVTGFGNNILYHNRGHGTFEDVTQKANVGGGGWSTGAAFGDYNRDGFVDLYVTRYVEFSPHHYPTDCLAFSGIPVSCGPQHYKGSHDILYRNNGNGTFTDVSQEAGILSGEAYNGLGVIFFDYNSDGFPDIYVANDVTPANLWHNNGDGTFTDGAVLAGCAFSEDGREQARMGVDVGDFDHSGHLSIFTTNFSSDYNTLFKNNGDGTFVDLTSAMGLASPSLLYLGWGTGFLDYDNDGWLDLFVVNGHLHPEAGEKNSDYSYKQPKLLFRNTGSSRFVEIGNSLGSDLSRLNGGRGAAFADFDNDGDMDILVVNIDDFPELLKNEGGNRNHFVSLGLVGTRSNRDGIGARIEVQTASTVQIQEVRSGASFLSHSDLRAHFGVGKAQKINAKIKWPSGTIEVFEGLEANYFYSIREGEGIVRKRSPLGMLNISHTTH